MRELVSQPRHVVVVVFGHEKREVDEAHRSAEARVPGQPLQIGIRRPT